jgi:hypothetical protein
LWIEIHYHDVPGVRNVEVTIQRLPCPLPRRLKPHRSDFLV